eukprot:1457410-Karenia_brevis.AAC.1
MHHGQAWLQEQKNVFSESYLSIFLCFIIFIVIVTSKTSKSRSVINVMIVVVRFQDIQKHRSPSSHLRHRRHPLKVRIIQEQRICRDHRRQNQRIQKQNSSKGSRHPKTSTSKSIEVILFVIVIVKFQNIQQRRRPLLHHRRCKVPRHPKASNVILSSSSSPTSKTYKGKSVINIIIV